MTMTDRVYIGLVHKDSDSSYGISFPDVLGVISAEDTLEAVMREGAVALAFAFDDWDGPLPEPRTIEELRKDPEFIEWSRDAIIVAIRPQAGVAHAAE
jgi:predicted RNase H-like HicB family nuclease